MNVGLAERVKDAGSIAFKAGQYERAISLYTEALPPTDSVPELKVNLLGMSPAHLASSALHRSPPSLAIHRCFPSFQPSASSPSLASPQPSSTSHR